MIAFIIVIMAFGFFISYPAYSRSKKKGNEDKVILFALPIALAFWVLLIGNGYGAQSLSNIIEVIYIMIAASVLSYAKTLILDKHIEDKRKTSYALIAILLLLVLALRTFMPNLPE